MMTPFSHGELFAGVGSFGMGFERAGIDTLWRAEIDPACQGVLRRHHPTAALWGDVRTLRGAQLAPADIISAGFPCQDVSVAGRRHGLSGHRSGLFFEIPRIVREMREATLGRCPTFLVLENVPGLLSSHGGRDFAVVLRELAELRPMDICWRVLDAQHFGVAQRRRRLFVVVDFAGQRAGPILFEPQSSVRHPAPGREEGQGVAACLTGGAGGGRAHGKPNGSDRRTIVPVPAAPLTAGSAAGRGVNRPGRRREDDSNLVAGTLTPGAHPGGLNGREAESGHLVVNTGIMHDASGALKDCNGAGISEGGPAHTLNGRERQAVYQCHGTNLGAMGTLRAGNGHTTGGVPFVAEGCDALSSSRQDAISGGFGVRRLTPMECERLMGWEDRHTELDDEGRRLADSVRYRLIGNGVVANVTEWIGRRIVAACGDAAG